MKLSLISSLAFAAAMMVAPSVMAQDAAAATMIGAQAISADDLPKVQAQCDLLAGVEGGSMLQQDDETPDDTKPNNADQATTTIDLALITIEECKTAGLSK